MRPQISISMCSSSNARAPAHITQPYLHTYAGAGARARALTEGATAQRVASPCPDDAFHVTLCILCIQIFELGISHARRSVACVRVCVCMCEIAHCSALDNRSIKRVCFPTPPPAPSRTLCNAQCRTGATEPISQSPPSTCSTHSLIDRFPKQVIIPKGD